MNVSEAFRAQVSRNESEIDLFLAALLIGTDEYPELDMAHYRQLVANWTAGIRRSLPADADIETRLRTLNNRLFTELGFRGNAEDYDDPRNSFINEVLERRVGIPISLSIVYLEIGTHLGLDLVGISFPGHFLVKLPHAGGEVVLDPFNGGVSLTRQDLINGLHSLFGSEVDDLAPFLAPAGKKQILVRMLANLKNVYLKQGSQEKALDTINKSLQVDAQQPEQYRERGALLQSMECYHAALKDFEHYLETQPQAEDIETIRGQVIKLQRQHRRLN